MEQDVIRSPDMERKNRVPPGQSLTRKFPVLHHGAVPVIDLDNWTFTISGLVQPERRLSYQEFMFLPHGQVLSDIHCVTGWSRLDNLWEGIGTGVLRNLTAILPQAKFVMVHAAGGFTTNLTLEDFFAIDVLFAFKHDNEFLKAEHGYPLRLVVPRLYFWKSAKWVEGVEFMETEKEGFWESHGYHIHGDPWREERFHV